MLFQLSDGQSVVLDPFIETVKAKGDESAIGLLLSERLEYPKDETNQMQQTYYALGIYTHSLYILRHFSTDYVCAHIVYNSVKDERGISSFRATKILIHVQK